MADTTIGQYRITGVIGRGGMGAVYSAEHALIGRQAAIKVLLPELSQKQDIVMRFFNEARAATAIRHPGIVEIYDFGWTPEGAAFIVMERLDGETVGRRAARARLSWTAALAVVRQIAGALSAAHAKGIVHRDLKPDNVFLVSDPEVPGGERIKLLDFGIAKLGGDPSSSGGNVTRTGAVIGTPTYMAPEQCRGVAVDHRADLYALGCVLYELCGGRPPFIGEGSGDVLAAHIHLPVPALSGLTVDVPPAVERLVMRLLAKVPGERVQSAEELIREIDAITSERTVNTPGPRRAVPMATAPSLTTLSGSATTHMRPPGARRRWPLAAFVTALAAITVVVVVVVMRRDAPGEPAAKPAAPVAAAVAVVAEPAKPAPVAEPPAPAPTAAPVAEPPKPAPVAEPPKPAPPSVDVVPSKIAIDVTSTPAGAQVVLDGAPLGRTPLHTTVTRRDREAKLVVRLAGYLDQTLRVHTTEPVNQQVVLRKQAPASAPAPSPPAVAPTTKPANPDRDRSVNPF